MAGSLNEGQRLTAYANLTAFERPTRALLAGTVAEVEVRFDLHIRTWLEALATASLVRGVFACGSPNAYGQALDRVRPVAEALGVSLIVRLPLAKRGRREQS